jgi:hypothetical protein
MSLIDGERAAVEDDEAPADRLSPELAERSAPHERSAPQSAVDNRHTTAYAVVDMSRLGDALGFGRGNGAVIRVFVGRGGRGR